MDNFKNTSSEINEKCLLLTQVYNELSNTKLDLSYVDEIITLKNECKLINNLQYFYLFDILLCDIYINCNQLDDALNLALKDYDEIDKDKFTDIHIMILDRVIYVYITKQFYQSALRYTTEKKLYLNNQSNEVINRWYLEMAYIHEALGEKNRSLIELAAILENNPDDNTKLVALSNITKLFIDAGNINEALLNLGDCFALCFKLDDQESENYCNYLRAKIYRLQKSYKKALKFFEDLFKTLDNIENDNFNYLNEYLVLLQDIKDYNNARKVCEKFIEQAKNSTDLYNKKMFFENYLRIRSNLATGNKNNFDYLFDIIYDIEKEISRNKDIKINEIKDVEINFEIKNQAKEKKDKIVRVVELLKNVNGDTIRDYLMNYSKLLERECGVFETQLYIFSRDYETIAPVQGKELSNIEVFNYKVNRLYERKLSYNDLNNSVIEMLFNGNNNIVIDSNDDPTDIIDPITHLSHKDLKNRYINMYGLFNKDSLYGAVNFISKSIDIINDVNGIILQIATGILEKNLLKMFADLNFIEQRGLVTTALSGADINIIYYNVNTKRIYLPEQIKKLIGLQSSEISFDEYEKLIDSSDKIKYRDKIIAIENNKEYSVSYHLNIDGNILSIFEQAKPYNDSYYYGTISNADITKSITTLANVDKVFILEDLLNEINILKNHALNNDISFDVSIFNVEFNEELSNYEKSQIIKEIYQNIKFVYSTKTYLLDSTFVVISSDKLLNKHFKEVKRTIIKNYEINSRVITPTFKSFVMSYPKQFVKVDDMIELIDFCIEKVEEETLDKKCYAKYIAYKTINDCAYNALCLEKINFVYNELSKDDKKVGLLGVPNIKGLNSQDSLSLISSKIKIKLDEKQIETIISDKKDNVFLSISMQSIKNLLLVKDDSYFKAVKISLILEDFTEDYISVIKDIKRIGYDVIISGNDLCKLTLELINNNLIDGVYNIDDNNKSAIKYLNSNVYLLTANDNNNELFSSVIRITDNFKM